LKKPTPDDATPDGIKHVIAEIVSEIAWDGPIGLGYPGIVKKGVCYSAANVSEKWLNFDAAGLLGELTDHDVAIINDADAAGVTELRFGAARTENHDGGGSVLLLTFGTGIGSALLYRGRLYPNTEFGHVQMEGQDAEKLAAASVRVKDDLSWDEWTDRVNRYFAVIEFLVSPDLIVFGGGISEDFDIFRDKLNARARLVRAELTNRAGLIGAALALEYAE
jgi:polyphosphate glucokinase